MTKSLATCGFRIAPVLFFVIAQKMHQGASVWTREAPWLRALMEGAGRRKRGLLAPAR